VKCIGDRKRNFFAEKEIEDKGIGEGAHGIPGLKFYAMLNGDDDYDPDDMDSED